MVPGLYSPAPVLNRVKPFKGLSFLHLLGIWVKVLQVIQLRLQEIGSKNPEGYVVMSQG
jgi:hypothetical protein